MWLIPYWIGFRRPRTGGHAEKMLQGLGECLLRPLSSWHCLASCLEIVTALKGQCHEIFCFWFFSWISFPQPESILLRQFGIFSKIRGDIRKSRCTTSINDSGVNDTGGKFATGINDTDGKFASGVNDTGGKQCEQLSNCWQLKMNLKIFLSICLHYHPKVSKRNKKKISDVRLFPFGTGVVHLELKETVSWDKLKKCWKSFTELGLTKGPIRSKETWTMYTPLT